MRYLRLASWLLLCCVSVACSTSPKVNSSQPTSTPEREAIKGAIRAQMREISACWKEHLRHNPNDEGKLTLSWNIDKNGTAQHLAIEQDKSTIRNTIFSDCVIAQIRQTKFPPQSEGEDTRVVYPFSFKRLVEFPYERPPQ